MSLNESAMQSHSLHPQDAVHGFGCSQQVFCRAKFAFAERSAAMKAPVGLLSDRTVCDSRWRGLAPTSSQMYIRLHCLRVLWSLSTCPPILKIILQARPSVFKFNLKRTVIFVQNEMHAAKASCTQKRRRYLRFFVSKPEVWPPENSTRFLIW